MWCNVFILQLAFKIKHLKKKNPVHLDYWYWSNKEVMILIT